MRIPFNSYNIQKSMLRIVLDCSLNRTNLRTMMVFTIAPSLKKDKDSSYVPSANESIYDYKNKLTFILYNDKFNSFLSQVNGLVDEVIKTGSSPDWRTTETFSGKDCEMVFLSKGNTFGFSIRNGESNLIYSFPIDKDGNQNQLQEFLNFINNFTTPSTLTTIKLMEIQAAQINAASRSNDFNYQKPQENTQQNSSYDNNQNTASKQYVAKDTASNQNTEPQSQNSDNNRAGSSYVNELDELSEGWIGKGSRKSQEDVDAKATKIASNFEDGFGDFV